MNRRKAIFRFSLLGVGITAGLGVYEWYSINKAPDLNYAEKNRELIAALAETLLPATDSPGARETAVQDFIIKMLRNCMERKEQNTFIAGLKDMQAHCAGKYGKEYQDCAADEQEQALAYFEKKGRSSNALASKIKVRLTGKSFFTLLKEYTVEGYCTSELGATKGLAYILVPGNFEGCIPLKPGQRSWATN